jgi:hypothetical protein
MSLLNPDKFELVFAPLQNHNIGFFPFKGNVDYHLINSATEQLLFDYQINYRIIKQQEIIRGECYQPLDVLLISGGDYLNNTNPETEKYLQDALVLGVPVTVLPHSIHSPEIDVSPYERIYVRDENSLRHCQEAVSVPELSLALRAPWEDEGVEAKTGVWLRNDSDRIIDDLDLSLGDPAHISWSPSDYFGLASKFEHIVTDRLHFAIAGLLTNRRVTLLPDVSGSNRIIYENWLKELGCRWRNSLLSIKTDRGTITSKLWKRLSSPPSGLVDWNSKLCRNDSWTLEQTEKSTVLRNIDSRERNLNPTALLVWSLCDGADTVEDICCALSEHYQAPVLDVARDVQSALQSFNHIGALKPLSPDLSEKSPRFPVPNRYKVIDVDIKAPRKQHGRIRWSANVRGTSLGDFIHYFDFDARWRSALTKRADPFVLALLPRAMHDGADLRINGAPVDAQLLDHLDEYQQAWHSWRPDEIQPVSILADESEVASQYSKPALTAFSGGLDSMHTVYRHAINPDGRRNHKLEAALMVCGFDIPINDHKGFSAALARVRPVINDAGIDLIDVYTNIRTHMPSWVVGHAAALASVLCLFSGRFGSGLIPSTFTYQRMKNWGSNPVSDPLLGGAFSIEHDSAAFSRFDKLTAISDWSTGLQTLRVCWLNRDSANNCGHCDKCYQLAIYLQALGLEMECFDDKPDASLLKQYTMDATACGFDNSEFSCILKSAQENAVNKPWVEIIQSKLASNN